MSVALKKADGDLFCDPETGRGEEVSGPTKVNQELFSLYASDYDESRNWGSRLSISYYRGVRSLVEFRTDLYSELSDAHARYVQKQNDDLYLDEERERVREFARADVYLDPQTQSALFVTEALVGDENTTVGRSLMFDFKPLSIRHVVPPPMGSTLNFFKG